jgi:DNA-directed RNA polymerase subunit B
MDPPQAPITDAHVDWHGLPLLEHLMSHFSEFFKDIEEVFTRSVAIVNRNRTAAQQVTILSCFDAPHAMTTPATCERNKQTYGCAVSMGLRLGSKDVRVGFMLPVMVKSKPCRDNVTISRLPVNNPERIGYEADIGGYFVIKGIRYVIVSQNTRARNDLTVTRVATLASPLPLPRAFKGAEAQSYTLKLTGPASTMQWDAIIVRQARATSHLMVMGTHKKSKYPLVLLLRHLEITRSDLRDLMRPDVPDTGDAMEVDGHAVQPPAIYTSIDLLYENEGSTTVALQDVAAHLGDAAKRKTSIMHFVRRLLLVMHGAMRPDTPDLIKHRRVLVAADMYRSLLESCFTRLLRECLNNATNADRASVIITEAIENALKTGEWPHNNMKGVTTMMNTTNALAALSNLRRVSSQLTQSEGGSNIIQQRLVYSDFPGRFCFVEVPTGEHAGLVRNPSIGTRITCSTTARRVHFAARNDWLPGLERWPPAEGGESATVWLDGEIQAAEISASAKDVRAIVADFRSWRRGELSAKLCWGASIEWVPVARELHIRTDGGRILRQLRNLATGNVEWIDAAEEATMVRVALSTETPQDIAANPADYQEICEDLLLGVTASVQRFINHAQGPRIVYQCSQSKQAAAGQPYGVGKHLVPDTNYYLATPQQPLVRTFAAVGISEKLGAGAKSIGGIDCNGQVVMMAVLSYDGFGQEDSIIMKKSAIERGLFRVISRSTYSGELETDRKRIESVRRPSGIPAAAAAHLIQEDGLPRVGATSKAASPILIVCTEDTPHETFNTGPVQSKSAARITVEHVQRPIRNRTAHAAVSVTQLMSPAVGDKFVTPTGQKATIGCIVPDADMPVDANGVSPDILFNANSFPSRMTASTIIEALLAKEIVMNGGETRVMSAFSVGVPLPRERGKELLIDGRTGKQLLADVFLAPAYWQRLEHVARRKSGAITPEVADVTMQYHLAVDQQFHRAPPRATIVAFCLGLEAALSSESSPEPSLLFFGSSVSRLTALPVKVG